MKKTVLTLRLVAAGFRPADAQQCTVLCKPAVSSPCLIAGLVFPLAPLDPR